MKRDYDPSISLGADKSREVGASHFTSRGPWFRQCIDEYAPHQSPLSHLRTGPGTFHTRLVLRLVPVPLRHLVRGLRLLLLLIPPRSNSTTWRVRALLSHLAPIGYYFEPEVFYLM